MSIFLVCAGLLDLNILLHFKYFIYLYGLTQFSSSDVLSYHITEENCLHFPLSCPLFSPACFCIILKAYFLFLLRTVLQCIQIVPYSMKNLFCLCDFREPEFIAEYHTYIWETVGRNLCELSC